MGKVEAVWVIWESKIIKLTFTLRFAYLQFYRVYLKQYDMTTTTKFINFV